MRANQTIEHIVNEYHNIASEFTSDKSKILQQLKSQIPLQDTPPQDSIARRKWALQGLKEFYKDLPFRSEDRSAFVEKLASYQEDCWADRWITTPHGLPKIRLYPKSQKIGASTFFLLEDIHIALTRANGKEVIICAQTQPKAEDHLEDIKEMLMGSKYAPFVTKTSSKDLLKLENSNPKDKTLTKIWAVGIPSIGKLLSNKSVEHIHLSDVTSADCSTEELDRLLSAVRSRIVKSRGTMVFEGPFRGPNGQIYDRYQELCQIHNVKPLESGRLYESDFYLMRRIPYEIAISEGVLSEEVIERERQSMSPQMFAMLYEANPLSGNMLAYGDVQRRTSSEATDFMELFS